MIQCHVRDGMLRGHGECDGVCTHVCELQRVQERGKERAGER